MLILLIHWLLNALSLMIVAALIPGIQVQNFPAALLAVVVIGLVNATLGLFLKVLTFPLTIVTFGVFLLVINALMLRFAAALVPGFVVNGFVSAFLGALVLALTNMVLRAVVFQE